jgi:NhaP-type Na+/H+ or K+/H+ antiporter
MSSSFIYFILFAVSLGVVLDQLRELLSLTMPYVAMLLIGGIIVGVINKDDLGDLGRSIDEFEELSPDDILLIFLPILILEPAVSASYHILQKELGAALVLAVPGVLRRQCERFLR